MQPYWARLCAVLMMLWSIAASAQQAAPISAVEKTVSDNVNTVLSIIHRYITQGLSEQSLPQFIAKMEASLEPVVGFPLIAARVMGEHWTVASDAQKRAFIQAFKDSMISTYASGLMSFGTDYRVELVSAPEDASKTQRNTQVYMEVIKDNSSRFHIVYSMYYSPKSQSWQMQNMIFNGINLGITFRSQFDQIVKDNNNDLDASISGWRAFTDKSYQQLRLRNAPPQE